MITQRRDDAVLTLTLDNRDHANALTEGMLVDLTALVDEASTDEGLRGILLRGADGAGFSAGMDTTLFAHSDPDRAFRTIDLLGRVCDSVRNCAIPVAAAVRRYCIGGALEIAAAADFRIGADDSWYSMPEVRIGIPSVLDAVSLHRLMGWTKATELILTGNRFTAAEMERYGFLNRTAPFDDVDARALELLAAVAESDRAVIAQQKRMFARWRNTLEHEAFDESKREFAHAFERRD